MKIIFYISMYLILLGSGLLSFKMGHGINGFNLWLIGVLIGILVTIVSFIINLINTEEKK